MVREGIVYMAVREPMALSVEGLLRVMALGMILTHNHRNRKAYCGALILARQISNPPQKRRKLRGSKTGRPAKLYRHSGSPRRPNMPPTFNMSLNAGPGSPASKRLTIFNFSHGFAHTKALLPGKLRTRLRMVCLQRLTLAGFAQHEIL